MKKICIILWSILLMTGCLQPFVPVLAEDDGSDILEEEIILNENEEIFQNEEASQDEIDQDDSTISFENEEETAEIIEDESAEAQQTPVSETNDVNSDKEVIASGSCGTNAIYTIYDDYSMVISGTGAMSSVPWKSYADRIISVEIDEGITSIGGGAFSGCSALTSITIPDSVMSIGVYAFRDCSSLTSIIIPDSVTSIKEGTFFCCSSLTSIIIPDSVTSIGGSAFSGCTSLTSITIPDSVTSIGNNAFSGCSALTSITIPDSVTLIEYYTFSDCSSLTSITIPDSVTSIGNNAFSGCSALTSITIPDSVTSIASSTFDGCSSLASVTIGNSVMSIGVYAFRDCSSLTSIIIPDSVTSIGGSAFSGCTSLTSITIPDSVTSIGNNAFSGCSALTSITIPDSVTLIEYYTFSDCSSLTSITIPDSVTSIGNNAFSGCSALTSITIPDSVRYIRNSSFSDCTSLTSITIPDSVEYLDEGAFSGCTSLESVTIGNFVTSIGYSTFYNCSSLTSIIIPDSVTSIGNNAFSGCSSLTSVTIGNSVTSISDYAFSGCSSLTSIIIPDSVTSIGKYAFSGCTSLNYVDFSSIENLLSISFSDYYSNPLNCGHNLYFGGELVTDLEIPQGIEFIPVYAFSGCSSLTSITIPDSVTSISDYAFYGCSALTSITIPDSVRYIRNSSFSDCTSLTSIDLPDSVTSISDYAFSGCSSLTSVMIGNSVTSIGYRTFYNCTSLTSITIPDSVTSIGGSAFSGCRFVSLVVPNNLTSIGSNAIPYSVQLYYVSSEMSNIVSNLGLNSSKTIYTDMPDEQSAIDKWGTNWNNGAEVVYNCSLSLFNRIAEEYALYHTEYTITYYYNGGSGYNPTSYTYDPYDVITLDDPYRTGYQFKGWYENPSFTGEPITEIRRSSQRNYTLYAKWQRNRYYIRYDSNGLFDYTYDQEYEYGVVGRISENRFLSGKVTLLSWNTSPDGSGRSFEEGEEILNLSSENDAVIVLYAQWNIKYNASMPYSDIESGSLIDRDMRISLFCDTPDSRIYYTTDASLPNEESTLYEDSIIIDDSMISDDGTVIIKAYAVADNFRDSDVAAFIYTVKEEGYEKIDPRDMPPTPEQIPSGLWTSQLPDLPYTGKAVTQDLRVYYRKTRLTEGKDYTLKYSSNTKAGTATVTITGKGNYTGTLTKTFTITPLDISSAAVTLNKDVFAYNGKSQKPTVSSVIVKGNKLKANTDYTVSYETASDDPKSIGSSGHDVIYHVAITGKGSCTGTVYKEYRISHFTLMSSLTITGFKSSILYDGTNPCTQDTLIITDRKNNYVLQEGTDYELEHIDNDKVGTATVIIRGLEVSSNYIGTLTKTFKVTGTSISKYKADLVSAVYTGEPITQDDVKLYYTTTVNKITEKHCIDPAGNYTVEYLNNVNAGTATVIYTGMGAYTGTLKKTFRIVPQPLTDTDKVTVSDIPDQFYMKGGSKPVPSILFNGNELEAGKDFTLSYKNNTKLGTATLTIKGKGNFSGTLTKTFMIGKKDLSKVSITIPDKVCSTKANAWKSAPVLTDTDGKKLVAGTDYEKNIAYTYLNDTSIIDGSDKTRPTIIRHKGEEVQSNDILPVNAVIKVTVTGKGNYEGTREGTFRIIAVDISKAKVTIPVQYYTGKPVWLNKEDITVKVGSETLSSLDYDILSYSNNIQKGTATVTLKGKGKYGGTKTVSFKISQRSMGITIRFIAGEGTTGTMKDQIIYKDTRLTNNAYKKAGCSFLGWSTHKNAAVPEYPATYIYPYNETYAGTTVILYAVWGN